MASSKHKSPTPTELIDWLNGEGLIDLDWDFPEDGNLIEAGMDEHVAQQVAEAVADEYGVELEPEELTGMAPATPESMAALIASRLA